MSPSSTRAAPGWLPGEREFGGVNRRNKAVGAGEECGLTENRGPGEESVGVDPPSSSWAWGRVMAPEDVHVLTQL